MKTTICSKLTRILDDIKFRIFRRFGEEIRETSYNDGGIETRIWYHLYYRIVIFGKEFRYVVYKGY